MRQPVHDRAAAQGAVLLAEDALGGRVGVADAPFGVEHQQAALHRLDQVLERDAQRAGVAPQPVAFAGRAPGPDLLQGDGRQDVREVGARRDAVRRASAEGLERRVGGGLGRDHQRRRALLAEPGQDAGALVPERAVHHHQVRARLAHAREAARGVVDALDAHAVAEPAQRRHRPEERGIRRLGDHDADRFGFAGVACCGHRAHFLRTGPATPAAG
jgi:hypothetical protein